jgi:hypothetical protein
MVKAKCKLKILDMKPYGCDAVQSGKGLPENTASILSKPSKQPA